MSHEEQRTRFRPPARSSRTTQNLADPEMPQQMPPPTATETTPPWLNQFVWSVLWKVVGVFLATVLMVLLVRELRHLLRAARGGLVLRGRDDSRSGPAAQALGVQPRGRRWRHLRVGRLVHH